MAVASAPNKTLMLRTWIRHHHTWSSISAYLHHPPIAFYRPDVFPAAQPTVSKHWRTSTFGL